ncbi:MAG: bacillithiol biosynthesis deacetylase BshB1 [Planctomycetes bacterium]|nr:bacillithiol biosynthesis deacetylase BshB1 [Planctomycetota bacterium]
MTSTPAAPRSRTGGLDLLAVGPHPDDVEICAGGLIILSVRRGYRVGVLDLTAGEAGTRGTTATRAQEAAAAAEVMGVAARECLGLPDGGLAMDRGFIRSLVEAIRRMRPRVIVTNFPDDDHPDHVWAGRLVKEAAHHAGKPRFAAAGEPHETARIMYYEGRRPAFVPSLIVDVTEAMERKRAAVRCHASQLLTAAEGAGRETFLSSPRFEEWWLGRHSYHGALIGARYGEAYWIDRPPPVADPLALFPAPLRPVLKPAP